MKGAIQMTESGEIAGAEADYHQDHPAESMRFYAQQLNALAEVFGLAIGRADAQECYLREAIGVAQNASTALRRKSREWGITS
jgi:hypothetical protein